MAMTIHRSQLPKYNVLKKRLLTVCLSSITVALSDTVWKQDSKTMSNQYKTGIHLQNNSDLDKPFNSREDMRGTAIYKNWAWFFGANVALLADQKWHSQAINPTYPRVNPSTLRVAGGSATAYSLGVVGDIWRLTSNAAIPSQVGHYKPSI